jgi:hypothetical protein
MLWKKFKENQTVYYPITRYYTDKDGKEHLVFNVQAYVWNSTTLNSTDPKFLTEDEESCKQICDILNRVHGY